MTMSTKVLPCVTKWVYGNVDWVVVLAWLLVTCYPWVVFGVYLIWLFDMIPFPLSCTRRSGIAWPWRARFFSWDPGPNGPACGVNHDVWRQSCIWVPSCWRYWWHSCTVIFGVPRDCTCWFWWFVNTLPLHGIACPTFPLRKMPWRDLFDEDLVVVTCKMREKSRLMPPK